MSKRILVFADGTGNEGGLLPDESRTNVYKLYRATRTGPDSVIDPHEQLAFYVPGVGTSAPGHVSRFHGTKETFQQAVGQGLKSRIRACYKAIIGSWRPGDSIYIFGFSRGAYTARCVAHVLEAFGIPSREPGSDTLSLDPGRLEAVAKRAVNAMYPFGFEREDGAQAAGSGTLRRRLRPAPRPDGRSDAVLSWTVGLRRGVRPWTAGPRAL